MWRRNLPQWSNILKRLSKTADVWVGFTFFISWSNSNFKPSNRCITHWQEWNLPFSWRKLPSWPPNAGNWAVPKVFWSFLHTKKRHEKMYFLEDVNVYPLKWYSSFARGLGATVDGLRLKVMNKPFLFLQLDVPWSLLFHQFLETFEGKKAPTFLWRGTDDATTWRRLKLILAVQIVLQCLRRLA